eukprot:COSAG01_NODE_14036_length_1504_cov_1.845552_4_plen_24_part_01
MHGDSMYATPRVHLFVLFDMHGDG